MTLFATLIIVIITGSAIFCFLAIGRLLAYNHRYHLPESKYTRMFGFMTKGQMAVLYIALVAADAVFGLWFIFT